MSIDSTNIEVQDFEQMLEAEKKQWQRRSIYKLPASVTDINHKAYTPQVVSLGPYHRKNENLKPMEGHKDRAVKHYLKRSGLNFDYCLRSLLVIERELMDAYDWLDPELLQSPGEFLKLMIRDGIFMLEIFGDSEKNASSYASNDPIFGNDGNLYVLQYIKRDMLILENQIPMKVLHKLYRLQPESTGEDANKVVFPFFYPFENANAAPTNSLHILDMCRTVMIGQYPPSTTEKEGSVGAKSDASIIRSAVGLHEAGIKIRNAEYLRNIRFQRGELWLPPIIIHEMTEPLFRNLMAYEQFHGASNHVTAYVFFMNRIINAAPDVSLLCSSGIILNSIGSDAAVVKLFNSLSKDIALDEDNPHIAIYESLSGYCKRKIPKYRVELATLFRTYFKGKWSVISLLAGVLLFALTITQTVYAIMDFNKKG